MPPMILGLYDYEVGKVSESPPPPPPHGLVRIDAHDFHSKPK